MLDLLSDDQVMKALGFYGGGLATVIGALWVAYTKLSARPQRPKAKPASTEVPGKSSLETTHVVGDVSVTSVTTTTPVPLAPWIVLGIGLLAVTAAVVLGGGQTTIENGASVGGDMRDSTINIGK